MDAATRRAVPRGLLGMLAVVALVEASHAWFRLDVPGVTDDWVRDRHIAAGSLRDVDVLVLGDSAVKFGVVPGVVESGSGRTCFNLAVLGGSPAISLALLRRALDGGARPSAVVVDALPHVLALDPRARSKRWPRLLNAREVVDLAATARDPSLVAPYLFDRLVVTSLERDNLRAGVVAALKGETAARRLFFRFQRRNWDANRGAMVLPGLANPVDPEVPYRENFPAPWACHPVNAAYVRALLDLTDEQGIRVYWLLPPVDPKVQSLCDQRGQEGRVSAFVRESVAGRGHVTVVDARHAGFEPPEFVDWAHVNRNGALALSEGLARVLAGGSCGGEAWVALAKPDGPWRGPEVEDINQSRLAVVTGR